jgi:penicillin amidase
MKRPLRLLLGLVVALVLLIAAGGVYGVWLIRHQGVPPEAWATFGLAKVRFDAHHIPTIEASDWPTAVQAQGYVVASERLFQMDLIRRKAGGRLAEWFGAPAFEHDAKNAAEDRLGTAQRGARSLPEEERFFCEAYAKGVNQFIQDYRGRWGLEYALLRVEPEPWACADSLLVVMEMAEFLTSTAQIDAEQAPWRRALSPAWKEWLFPTEHPWNKPLFGVPSGLKPPPPEEHLPLAPISAAEQASTEKLFEDGVAIGSNSWAYSGKNGVFLANDPHLGNGVPSIWFANRLKVTKADWVVGVSIPGIPAATIGMNPAVAWSFTNTGEDVDDLLEEKLSEDGSRYLARVDQDGEKWEPVRRETFLVKVKGEGEPRKVEAMFTHRGPLAKRPHLGDGLYSRQWLPLKEGMLRLPSIDILRARTAEDLHAALDHMRAPAQNAIFVTHRGDIGYRVGGTGVVRAATGLEVQDALVGEWRGFEAPETRRRLSLPADASGARWLATANERIWVDRFGHHWWAEDRKERIARRLAERDDYRREDMEALQLDTNSRLRAALLHWIAAKATPRSDSSRALADRWRAWDGASRTDPVIFAQSESAEIHLVNLVTSRVRAAFLDEDAKGASYVSWLRRAWLVSAIETTSGDGFAPFGLVDADLATYLLERVHKEGPPEPHQLSNRWKGQHPFAARIPVLGRLFAIEEREQWGAIDLVDASRPTHGPSLRMVWDMSKPWESTWTFPIGQSGHAGTPHYSDLQATWFDGKPYRVFEDPKEWEFVGREVKTN